MPLIRETDNLYRFTRFGIFNCFLVRENDGLTLVDTNFPGSENAILQAARSLGDPITRIALTHAHFDHVGSLDALTRALPQAKLIAGTREARMLHGDFSLDPGESGKPLLGFRHVRSQAHTLVNDGDEVGSLRVVACPGHTPGHIAFLDCRDNSLLAGDAFMTQKGVMAAGTFDLLFPLPAIFSWNNTLSAQCCQTRRPRAIPPCRGPWENAGVALRTNGTRRRDRAAPASSPTEPLTSFVIPSGATNLSSLCRCDSRSEDAKLSMTS